MLGKTTQQSSPARNLPTQFHVGDPGGRDDHIKRALAHHLVGDHDIPTARITCLGHAHVNESGSPTRDAQERACRAVSLDHDATSKPPWVSDAEIELVAYTSQGALTFRFTQPE